MHRTNPVSRDTDGDGNDDYYEYNNFPSDPINPDQDSDQLIDGLETGPVRELYHTSYLDSDTDNDGYLDGNEVRIGTNPLDAQHYPVTQTTVANRPPIANPQRVLTTVDEPVDIMLSGTDADRNSLAFFISQRPLHGILTPLTYTGIVSAKLIYAPNPGFSGADEFSFWAYNGSSYSKTPAKVSINISR